jgi:hypothetical protein
MTAIPSIETATITSFALSRAAAAEKNSSWQSRSGL